MIDNYDFIDEISSLERLVKRSLRPHNKLDITNFLLMSLLKRSTPITRADKFNKPLPTAESGLLDGNVTPTINPGYLRIYVCISVAGVLRVARTRYKETVTEDLNSGAALAAGASYIFTVPWRPDDLINLRYSVSSGTINRLLVDELGA